MHRLVGAVKDGRLQPCDITAEMIERCLGTGDDEELDLLVRTSGEIRLSDFLLWQVCRQGGGFDVLNDLFHDLYTLI